MFRDEGFRNEGRKIGWAGGTALGLVLALGILPPTAVAKKAPTPILLWINHLDLLPGDVDVLTSFNSTTSGVGGGLSGLIIRSTTTGDVSISGGNKVVEKGLEVPPGYSVTGVRVCYELSDPGTSGSFIDQIRISQLQSPPSTALVLLDDGTARTASGAVCADSMAPLNGTPIDPSAGGLRLDLRVKFNNVADKIVLRGLALQLSTNSQNNSGNGGDDQGSN